jgi:translation elongation factor EF-G
VRPGGDRPDDAGVVTERPRGTVHATVDDDDSGTSRSVVESARVNFEADYRERVSSTVHVPVDERAGLLHALRSATGGHAETATA